MPSRGAILACSRQQQPQAIRSVPSARTCAVPPVHLQTSRESCRLQRVPRKPRWPQTGRRHAALQCRAVVAGSAAEPGASAWDFTRGCTDRFCACVSHDSPYLARRPLARPRCQSAVGGQQHEARCQNCAAAHLRCSHLAYPRHSLSLVCACEPGATPNPSVCGLLQPRPAQGTPAARSCWGACSPAGTSSTSTSTCAPRYHS